MKRQLKSLLLWALKNKATDLHFLRKENCLEIHMRTRGKLNIIRQDIFETGLYDYLRFISGMNLCEPSSPQSGSFSIQIGHLNLDCRFSCLKSQETQTGVLRLLHSWKHFELKDLTSCSQAVNLLHSLCTVEHGLIISCGPTGSGKSTTIHALLAEMQKSRDLKIVSLEDPIEIRKDSMVQLQISPGGLSYEQGIEELMRHDPDVIFLGECRSGYAARMAVRAALTGTLVFTTLHAGNGQECLRRLEELGVNREDLRCVLKGIFAQRLEMVSENRKECCYEIWNEPYIEELFKAGSDALPALSMEECRKKRSGNYNRRTG